MQPALQRVHGHVNTSTSSLTLARCRQWRCKSLIVLAARQSSDVSNAGPLDGWGSAQSATNAQHKPLKSRVLDKRRATLNGRRAASATAKPAKGAQEDVQSLKLDPVTGWPVPHGPFSSDYAGLPAAYGALKRRLSVAVEAEKQEEKRAREALYQRSSAARLQEDGVLLLGLQAQQCGELYGSVLWRLQPTKGSLPRCRFKAGDSVQLQQDLGERGNVMAESDEMQLEGVVVELEKSHITLSLERQDSEHVADKLRYGPLWRVDLITSNVTSQRQLDALTKLASWEPDAQAAQLLVRAVLLGAPSAPAMAQRMPPWVSQAPWRLAAGAALSTQSRLNQSQRVAIATAITRTLTLWQGPPGTGKTWTLLSLMEVLVRGSAEAGGCPALGPILAAADTNAAVDNMLAGLLKRGIKALRIGNPAKVRPELRHATVEALAEATELGQHALRLRATGVAWLDKARKVADDPTLMAGEVWQMRQHGRDFLTRAETKMKDAVQEVLDGAEVVLCTHTGAGDALLEDRMFRMVVIDEASQATEPATLVPLVKGAHCCVLAGDLKQLPPTILSKQAFQQGLDVTLFERLSEQCGVEPLLLNVQYRMHPLIAQFPNARFYDAKLQNGAVRRLVPSTFPWPAPDCPVALVSCEEGRERRAASSPGDTSGEAQRGGGSYENALEAGLALAALHLLTLPGSGVKTACLLSPYKAQVKLLEALLMKHDQHFQHVDVTVATVDSFQGREADVVVFSTVRCNQLRKLGFVADPRRMNVALTRAKRGLVVLGSPSTLRSDQDWASYLGWLREQGAVMQPQQLPPPPWAARS